MLVAVAHEQCWDESLRELKADVIKLAVEGDTFLLLLRLGAGRKRTPDQSEPVMVRSYMT